MRPCATVALSRSCACWPARASRRRGCRWTSRSSRKRMSSAMSSTVLIPSRACTWRWRSTGRPRRCPGVRNHREPPGWWTACGWTRAVSRTGGDRGTSRCGTTSSAIRSGSGRSAGPTNPCWTRCATGDSPSCRGRARARRICGSASSWNSIGHWLNSTPSTRNTGTATGVASIAGAAAIPRTTSGKPWMAISISWGGGCAIRSRSRARRRLVPGLG